MKTQEEIEDRITLHQERAAKISNRLADEQVRFIKSPTLIQELRKQLDEENCAIVHLSWTLI